MTTRFDRQERMFGADGQARLHSCRVAVLGVGGLGSHVVQQLAFLGVGRVLLIDDDELEETNLNRLIGAERGDAIGTPKVEIAHRILERTDPGIEVEVMRQAVGDDAPPGLDQIDWVFGCFDNDAGRLTALRMTAELGLPYVDLATDVLVNEDRTRSVVFGGRVVVSVPGREGCLLCLDEIDQDEARRYAESPAARTDRERIYGVTAEHLAGSGPSVVCINGVVASLGVVEFMAGVTALREPVLMLDYRGHDGVVFRQAAGSVKGCYYCAQRSRTAELHRPQQE